MHRQARLPADRGNCSRGSEYQASERALLIGNRIPRPPVRSIWQGFATRARTRFTLQPRRKRAAAENTGRNARPRVPARPRSARPTPRGRRCRCVIRAAGRVSAANRGAICYARELGYPARRRRSRLGGGGENAGGGSRRPRSRRTRGDDVGRDPPPVRRHARPPPFAEARRPHLVPADALAAREAWTNAGPDIAVDSDVKPTLRVGDGGSLRCQRCHYVLSFSYK